MRRTSSSACVSRLSFRSFDYDVTENLSVKKNRYKLINITIAESTGNVYYVKLENEEFFNTVKLIQNLYNPILKQMLSLLRPTRLTNSSLFLNFLRKSTLRKFFKSPYLPAIPTIYFFPSSPFQPCFLLSKQVPQKLIIVVARFLEILNLKKTIAKIFDMPLL